LYVIFFLFLDRRLQYLLDQEQLDWLLSEVKRLGSKLDGVERLGVEVQTIRKQMEELKSKPEIPETKTDHLATKEELKSLEESVVNQINEMPEPQQIDTSQFISSSRFNEWWKPQKDSIIKMANDVWNLKEGFGELAQRRINQVRVEELKTLLAKTSGEEYKKTLSEYMELKNQ